MDTTWSNDLVRRIAVLVSYERPVEDIRAILIAEGLSEEEAFLTYMAAKVYAATKAN